MAARSNFLAVTLCTFLILSGDPVAAARLARLQDSRESKSNVDVAKVKADDSRWGHPANRCLRLQRNFNTQISRVRAKVTRASESTGVVSAASLVMTLRGLTRNFRAASELECAWISEEDADTDTMLGVAHENLDGNPCLPQARELIVAANQSNPEEMSTVAVQTVHMLISGNCEPVVFPHEETSDQPLIHSDTMEYISADVMEEVADDALETEGEEVDGSVLVEKDATFEYYSSHVTQPGYHGGVGQSDAVRAAVAVVLLVLSFGLLCSVGPAIMAIVSLIVLSVIVLFLAFFFTFVAVTLRTNPATGNQWLMSWLLSTWEWTRQLFGGQLASAQHWGQCYSYLR